MQFSPPQIRRKSFAGIFIVVFILGFVANLSAADFALGTNVTVKFASAATGREILGKRDEFIAALTPLDRRGRLPKSDAVTENELLRLIEGSVQEWTPNESNRIAAALAEISPKLARWRLPFPAAIHLIKTSGKEEFNNLYTRQNAIVIPAAQMAMPPAALRHFLIHELFHVLSRHDPELRKATYAVIGFRPVNEVVLPDALLQRKITNPDGVQNGWLITVTNRSQVVPVVPILLATGDSFDPNAGNVLDYFRLLAVKPDGTNWAPQLVAGEALLLKPQDVGGWSEQIGRNTPYIIHPDEILAENFVFLINGNTNQPTPRILSGMAEALRRRAGKAD